LETREGAELWRDITRDIVLIKKESIKMLETAERRGNRAEDVAIGKVDMDIQIRLSQLWWHATLYYLK